MDIADFLLLLRFGRVYVCVCVSAATSYFFIFGIFFSISHSLFFIYYSYYYYQIIIIVGTCMRREGNWWIEGEGNESKNRNLKLKNNT